MFYLPKPQQIRWNQNALRGEEARQAIQIRDDNHDMQQARHRMMMAKARQAQAAQAAEQKRKEQQQQFLTNSIDNNAIDGLSDFDKGYMKLNPSFARRVIEDKMKERLLPPGDFNGFKDKKQRLSAQGDFRKEFTKVSGDFIKVRDAQSRIEASAKDPSAAGDLALIFNYMKVLDPGSTVREGEFATAQNAAGIPARLRAQWNAVLSGQRLADTQRADFVNRSRLLFGRQEQQYNKTRKIYENIARRNGLDVESVLPDYSIAEQPVEIENNPNIKAAINPKTGERAFFDTRTGQRVR